MGLHAEPIPDDVKVSTSTHLLSSSLTAMPAPKLLLLIMLSQTHEYFELFLRGDLSAAMQLVLTHVLFLQQLKFPIWWWALLLRRCSE